MRACALSCAASSLLEWKAFSLVTKWSCSPGLIAALLHPPLHSLLSSLSRSLLSPPLPPFPPSLCTTLLFLLLPPSPPLLSHIVYLSISPSALFSLYLKHSLPISPVLSISSAFTLKGFFFPLPFPLRHLSLSLFISPRLLSFHGSASTPPPTPKKKKKSCNHDGLASLLHLLGCEYVVNVATCIK